MAAWAREAIRRAGRPGLHFASACSSAIGDIAACNPENGVRPSDGLMISVIAELITDFEALGKVAYALDYGCIKATHGGSVIGGWAGGPESSAVVSIADCAICLSAAAGACSCVGASSKDLRVTVPVE